MNKKATASALVSVIGTAVLITGCGAAATSASPQNQGLKLPTTPSSDLGALVPPITFIGPSESWVAPQLEADRLIAQDWAKLGVKVNLVTAPNWATFTGMLAKQPWQASAASYLGTQQRVDPAQLLSIPFLCNLPTNYGHFCNPSYDQAVNQSNAAVNQTQRKKYVDQAQAILAKDLPMVVEWYSKDNELYNKNQIKNLVPAVGAGLTNFWNYIEAQPIGSNTIQVGVHPSGPMNPWVVSSYNTDIDIQQLIYDTLARISPAGKAVPWAASSWSVVNSTTVDVTLRSGLQFSDGTPLTASDVAWTYKEMQKLKVPYYISDLSAIASITVTDPTHLVFHLSKPDGTLIPVTFTSVPILPKHLWASVADPTKVSQVSMMVGSGPYILKSYNPSSGQSVLVRNPHAIQEPKAAQIAFDVYSSSSSFFEALQKGTVDFGLEALITPSMIQQAQSMSQLAVKSSPGITVNWLTYNVTSGSPFANYPFRLALSQAVDSKTIVQSVLAGNGTTGDGIIAPANTIWHDSSVQFPSFSLSAAVQTLTKAGYGWDAQGHLHYPKNYQPQVLPN